MLFLFRFNQICYNLRRAQNPVRSTNYNNITSTYNIKIPDEEILIRTLCTHLIRIRI